MINIKDHPSIPPAQRQKGQRMRSLVPTGMYGIKYSNSFDRANVLVTLIVCTRNRASRLQPMLEGIKLSAGKENFGRLEVIIVDSDSNDETLAILQSWAALQSFPVTVIKAYKKGTSLARNIGISESLGDIISITDDDCVVSEEYFLDILNMNLNVEEPAIIGGRILLGNSDDLPITIKTDEIGSTFSGSRIPSGYIMSANFILTRATVLKIGGFDQNFGPGAKFIAAEDSEMMVRAILSNVAIRYDPSIIVSHFHGRKSAEEARLLYASYSMGDGALFAKYFFRHPMFLRRILGMLRDILVEFARPQDDPIFGRRKTLWRFRWQLRGVFNYLAAR